MTTTAKLSPGAEALLAYIRERDWVTYAEAENVLEPHIPVHGHMAIEDPRIPNLLFWAEVSEEFCRIMQELFVHRLIWRVPVAALSYWIDGKALALPIPKRRQKRYAKEVWVPTCLRPIERISAAEQKKYAAPAKED